MWNEGDGGRGESGASVSGWPTAEYVFSSLDLGNPKLTPVTKLEQTRVELPFSISRATVRKTEHETLAGNSARDTYRSPPVGAGCLIRLFKLPRGFYQIKKNHLGHSHH